MGMSRVGYWETYGRARPQHFQRDNKHILQKIEFVEAKFSRSGEKKKKTTQQTDSLSMSWKVCPFQERNVLAGLVLETVNLHNRFKRFLETHQ